MPRDHSFFAKLAVILTFALGLPALALAQGTGDIVGRVTDTSGAVLPGVSVTAQNTGTNQSQNTITNETGDYLFTALPIGAYLVKIELQGFQAQNTRVTLSAGDRARVDAKLAVGTLSETVQVTGEAPLLQTDSSTVSNLVNEKAVQDLPVNGRNFMRLVQLVPGATEGAANALSSGTRPDDRRQTSAVSVNGAPDNMNNQMIDGMDNNERAIGTVGVKPSMDAIAEVRVQTNLYTADTGRTAGGIINILTKSGSNQFHGSGYEFYRNSKFDQRDYFAIVDPILHQNQYGGSVGGPVVSNKTFFFGDYEGLRNQKGQVNNLTLPTALMRTGDFSELLPGTVIFDPTTSPRTPFPGNIIPADRLNPQALAYMSLLPANTNSGLANNAQITTIGQLRTHTTDGRIDHRFNSGNSIFGRYSYNRLNAVAPGGCDPASSGPFAGLSAVCRGPETGGFPGTNKTTAHATQANYVRVFSPSLIGEFKGGMFKTDLASLPVNYLTNASTTIGLPNVNINDAANGGGLATLTINGYTPLGDEGNVPLISHGRTQQYQATITKTMGSHSFKMGGGIIMRRFGVIQSQSPLGTFTFDTTLTRSTTNSGGNSMASFLLGYPATVTRQHSPYTPEIHTNEPSVFGQDDWRMTSWLTVNLGVRYDVFTPFRDENNLLSNLNYFPVTLDAPSGPSGTTPVVLVAGQNGVDQYAGVKTDYSNLAPRTGFAATLPHSMVLRGGYGLSFFPANVASGFYMKNPPLFSSYGPVTSLGASGGTPDLFFSNGLPAFDPNAVVSTAPADLAGAFRPVALNFRSTRMQQFNVQLEKDWKGNLVTVGYVGSRGDFVAASPNINLAPAGPGAIQPRRAYASLLPGVSNITPGVSLYTNSYDAEQVAFQRRFTNGLSLNTYYRWSNAQAVTSAPWDWTILEEHPDTQDVRHAWVLQTNYALPFAKNSHGFVHGVAAGWQVNAVANWQGGTPFGVTNSTALANTGGTDRPNLIGDPELPKQDRTVTRWFNTAAFQAQPANTVGNSPAIVLHGPPQRRLDLSFFKDVRVYRNSTVQLRYEVYNVTNTANFQNPISTLGSSNFGSLTSTGNAIPRQMQFAAKLLW